MVFKMRSNDLIKTLMTALFSRLNEINSGKCGFIDVSGQFIDGSSIIVLSLLQCTWTTSGSLDPVQLPLMNQIIMFFRTNLIGPEDQVFAKANSDILLAAYRAHNASVKALVPKDKLLVYRIGEGRVPLTFPVDQMNSL